MWLICMRKRCGLVYSIFACLRAFWAAAHKSRVQRAETSLKAWRNCEIVIKCYAAKALLDKHCFPYATNYIPTVVGNKNLHFGVPGREVFRRLPERYSGGYLVVTQFLISLGRLKGVANRWKRMIPETAKCKLLISHHCNRTNNYSCSRYTLARSVLLCCFWCYISAPNHFELEVYIIIYFI